MKMQLISKVLMNPNKNNQAGKKAVTTSASVTHSERVQKVMARSGLGSRRQLEKSISDGAILVNGDTAKLGASVSGGEKLEFNGRRYLVVDATLPHETLFYNKPVGELTTRSDPENRKTVFDRLPRPKQGRWVAVGRLDINTSGLLILTTDGELANAMMHPSNTVDREYACRIYGEVTSEHLENLRAGVELDDGTASFSDISVGGTGETNHWYQVTLLEGRNREVRRLWETQGLQVSRLQRVRYGAAFLPKGLLRGQWHRISPNDHRILREDVGLNSQATDLILQAEKAAHRQTANKKARRKTTKPIKGKLGLKRGTTGSTSNRRRGKK